MNWQLETYIFQDKTKCIGLPKSIKKQIMRAISYFRSLSGVLDLRSPAPLGSPVSATDVHVPGLRKARGFPLLDATATRRRHNKSRRSRIKSRAPLIQDLNESTTHRDENFVKHQVVGQDGAHVGGGFVAH